MPHATYSLLDFGDGRRLEQWGPYRLMRPDPTATGKAASPGLWTAADAVYEGEKGKGRWARRSSVPERWTVAFDDMQLMVKLAPYKHTGVFPEQQANWSWMRSQAVKAGRPLTVLNLFAYTGGATAALALGGHRVTHVDASKPTVAWARENAALNRLPPDRVRFLVDDAPAFVARERKRGKRYDAVILDPPAYGHGPSGGAWRVQRDLAPLLEQCCMLLTDRPSFLLLNGYAEHDTPESFHRLLTGILHRRIPRKRCIIDAAELLLAASDGRTLPTGIVARCAFP